MATDTKEQSTHWWGQNYAIVLAVHAHFHFVPHSQNSPLKTLCPIDVIKDKLHLNSHCQQTNISRISSCLVRGGNGIVLAVHAHFHFVAHFQNLPLKTSGRVDVIKDNLHLDSQCQQKNISWISSCLVRTNLCHSSSCSCPFSFCSSQPEFALENFILHWCNQG